MNFYENYKVLENFTLFEFLHNCYLRYVRGRKCSKFLIILTKNVQLDMKVSLNRKKLRVKLFKQRIQHKKTSTEHTTTENRKNLNQLQKYERK